MCETWSTIVAGHISSRQWNFEYAKWDGNEAIAVATQLNRSTGQMRNWGKELSTLTHETVRIRVTTTQKEITYASEDSQICCYRCESKRRPNETQSNNNQIENSTWNRYDEYQHMFAIDSCIRTPLSSDSAKNAKRAYRKSFTAAHKGTKSNWELFFYFGSQSH